MWNLIDSKTGQQINKKPYAKLTTAHRRADKLDLQYGAVRYVVRRHTENQK